MPNDFFFPNWWSSVADKMALIFAESCAKSDERGGWNCLAIGQFVSKNAEILLELMEFAKLLRQKIEKTFVQNVMQEFTRFFFKNHLKNLEIFAKNVHKSAKVTLVYTTLKTETTRKQTKKIVKINVISSKELCEFQMMISIVFNLHRIVDKSRKKQGKRKTDLLWLSSFEAQGKRRKFLSMSNDFFFRNWRKLSFSVSQIFSLNFFVAVENFVYSVGIWPLEKWSKAIENHQ